jgi:hypothetical protein
MDRRGDVRDVKPARRRLGAHHTFRAMCKNLDFCTTGGRGLAAARLKIGETALFEARSGVSPRLSGCAIYPSKAYAN